MFYLQLSAVVKQSVRLRSSEVRASFVLFSAALNAARDIHSRKRA